MSFFTKNLVILETRVNLCHQWIEISKDFWRVGKIGSVGQWWLSLWCWLMGAFFLSGYSAVFSPCWIQYHYLFHIGSFFISLRFKSTAMWKCFLVLLPKTQWLGSQVSESLLQKEWAFILTLNPLHCAKMLSCPSAQALERVQWREQDKHEPAHTDCKRACKRFSSYAQLALLKEFIYHSSMSISAWKLDLSLF